MKHTTPPPTEEIEKVEKRKRKNRKSDKNNRANQRANKRAKVQLSSPTISEATLEEESEQTQHNNNNNNCNNQNPREHLSNIRVHGTLSCTAFLARPS